MAVSFDIDQLAAAIAQSVGDYTDNVCTAVESKVTEVADLVLQEAKALSPRKAGKYYKGWVKQDKSLQGERKYVVWNKKYFSLVHLLEMGHAKRGGMGRVAARPHLRPAHDMYAGQLVSDIEEIIRNGG